MHVRHGARHLTSTSLLLSAHFTDGAAVNPLRPVSPPPPRGRGRGRVECGGLAPLNATSGLSFPYRLRWSDSE